MSASNITMKVSISDMEEFQELIKSLADNFEQLPAPVVDALRNFMDKGEQE